MRSNLLDDTTQFNGRDFIGSGRNDFQIRDMAFKYETDTISIPDEKISVAWVIPAAAEGSCGGFPPLGSGAISAVQSAGGAPLEVRAHIRFEGVFNSGAVGTSNEIVYPTEVIP
jgi:hypothetical protein